MAIRRMLADATDCLGPCAPLPALFEEVLRDWRGLPVHTARFCRANTLLAEMQQLPNGQSFLVSIAQDPLEAWAVRLLSATLLALARCPVPAASPGDEPAAIVAALANFTSSDSGSGYREALGGRFIRDETARPPVLLLLCFLQGLHEETLTYEQFAEAVLEGGVLDPAVTTHRPLRKINRLLDYLGLSDVPQVRQYYRRLVSAVWPQATVDNYPRWQWVTELGGPEFFPRALREFQFGDHSLMRLHELKYTPLSGDRQDVYALTATDAAIMVLLYWLRHLGNETDFPDGLTALHWLEGSNQAAATEAYAQPAWWEAWVRDGMPAARQALRWLQETALPESRLSRAEWLEFHLAPAFRRICANLLLSQAATGERSEEIVALAESGDLPAIRALALLPTPNEKVMQLLRRLCDTGGRPMRLAAKAALDHLAKRQGLPGAEELDRQHLLAAAWNLGPLAGERVRVGWEEGMYRLRLSVQVGKVQLEVLGPRGPLQRIPTELYRYPSYREARAAQKEAQSQYRLFKQHLEKNMLEARPLSVGEFRYLLANPIFAHLAERLVWQNAAGEALLWAGPDIWETCEGRRIDLSDAGKQAPMTLTVAHPITLAQADVLVNWQSVAVDRRLMQPFKQLFREIYLPIGEVGERCTRFAGRSIDTRRAYALLRAAGFAPGAGIARRDWPRNVVAHFCWASGTVSHDLFGPDRLQAVETGDIWFTSAGRTIPTGQVDPIIFSETLRAADFLTARAAVGDADLTSRETIILRATLLREVARSFNLTNIIVREEGPNALVLGKRATYRVNLASGTILLEPEGRQVMLPRHDPRWWLTEESDTTGEILAIVLTLAHDQEIGDLTFLAQLVSHPPL